LSLALDEKIYLNKFQPRPYQLPIACALENDGFKKLLIVMPRRAGKDVLMFNLCIRAALRRPGVYYYIFPTYAQAKKVIWQSSTNDGQRFLDFIPPSLIESANSQDMSIRLRNQSLIQLIGSDNIDSIVGTNPIFVIYSEAALQDKRAYQFLRPILAANGGTAAFISTPRGKNWFYELFQIAKLSSDWFTYYQTLDDTQHIPLEEIEKDRREGIMSEDLIQQEYYCSWDMGVEGAYYSKYLDQMRLNGRIGDVPHEVGFKVHTAWDIGNDCTSIIFFQTIGLSVRIIDHYENSGTSLGLEHYAKVVLGKTKYQYGRHIFPHDMSVTEWGGIRQTRLEKALRLGLPGILCDRLEIEDGIEAVRSAFSRIWIDENNCSKLLKSLENYRQEWDPKRNIYKGIPLHNWASHAADAMRYLCISIPKTKDGLSGEDIERNYREAMGGPQSKLPRFFNDDNAPY
jgi:phage terminase large subunit